MLLTITLNFSEVMKILTPNENLVINSHWAYKNPISIKLPKQAVSPFKLPQSIQSIVLSYRPRHYQRPWRLFPCNEIFVPTFSMLQTHCPHMQLPWLLHIVVLSEGSLKHGSKVSLTEPPTKFDWSQWQVSPKKPSLHLQMAHSSVPFLLHEELLLSAARVHSQSHK